VLNTHNTDTAIPKVILMLRTPYMSSNIFCVELKSVLQVPVNSTWQNSISRIQTIITFDDYVWYYYFDLVECISQIFRLHSLSHAGFGFYLLPFTFYLLPFTFYLPFLPMLCSIHCLLGLGELWLYTQKLRILSPIHPRVVLNLRFRTPKKPCRK
jgi:hypothetical protein